MLRRLLVLMTLMLIILPQTTSFAQNPTWDDGCVSMISSHIAETTDVLDYDASCEHYRLCDPSGDGDFLCQLATYQFMLEQCPLDDVQCADGALLFAAAMLVFDNPYGESLGWSPPWTVIRDVPGALDDFWNDDLEGALALYDLTTPEDYAGDIMMPISRALLHMRLDQPEEAFAELDHVQTIVFGAPLFWIVRSQLYDSLGRTDEASFDILALREYVAGDSQFDPLLASLSAQNPLDEQHFSEWLMYPVMSSSDGVGGNYVRDRTREETYPVSIGAYDDLDLLVLVGGSYFRDAIPNATQRSVIILTRTQSEPESYHRYTDVSDGEPNLTLTRQADVFVATQSIVYFEGASMWNYLLAPVDTADPRAEIAMSRHCDNTLSFIQIGHQIISPLWDYQISLRQDPTGMPTDTRPEIDETLTVIDGPRCDDASGETWWQGITENGAVGWFVENEQGIYLATPVAGNPTFLYCPDALPMLLNRGIEGRVLAGAGTQNLHIDANANSEVIAEISPDETFMVIATPRCADGAVWWYVDHQGIEGWIAEGNTTTYRLEAVVPDVTD